MKCAGAMGRENVGMSNRNCDENSQRRKPEVSSAMTIIGGLGDPKDNRTCGCGKPMASWLIFQPLYSDRWSDGDHKSERIIGFAFLAPSVVVRKIRQLSLMTHRGVEASSQE